MYGVSRYLAETDRRRDSGKGWLPFSRTIHEAIAAMDFFTVPDGDLPRALLLLRDQPQRAKNPALQLQRHGTSRQSVDRPATVERFSWRIGHLSTPVLDRDGKFSGDVARMLEAKLGTECWSG
jgi:hypothetical protein